MKNKPEGWDRMSPANQLSFENSDLQKRIRIQSKLIECLDGLLACYRCGSPPPEALLDRCNKARADLAELQE